ncbi:udp-glucose 4-epimerase [Seiridium cupressi]
MSSTNGKSQRLLITGSNGRIGRLLSARLCRPGRQLRLLDLEHDQSNVPPGAEFIQGSVTDQGLMARAADGVDAIVHLAGIAAEVPWPAILDVNVHGTWTVLEAARSAGVPKVVLASSNHAVGMQRRSGTGATTENPLRIGDGGGGGGGVAPDSYYGFSKTAMEALGKLFAAKETGLGVVAVRIGSCWAEPRNERALSIWLSPGDLARLVEAVLRPEVTGYHCVWGVSRNTRRWWSLDEGEAVGFHPVDDAEVFAHRFQGAETSKEERADIPDELDYVGGVFPSWDLGVHGKAKRP